MDGSAVVVTGAAGGMGRAISERLAAAGAHPILVDVDETAGAALASALGASFVRCDLSDLPQGVAALAEEVGRHVDVLDGIVNAAGVSSSSRYPEVSVVEWERVLRVNLSAPFFVVQALNSLLRRPGAAVVNITSAEATGVYASSTHSTPDYAAAKAGLKLVTECLAMDLAPEGIRVNAIAPGFTATPMTAGMRERLAPFIPGLVPLGRWGEPRDVADAALFLLSEHAAYVTGASLPVDGGFTLGVTERTFGGPGAGG
jgi:NAD(P)-dependent dehydrogenase (short-subunit alcohol dehydrogenase family)